MSFDELVNKHYNCLNQNDLFILEYIKNNKKECENLSIDELALKCNVSRTTILRFAKKLSLKGYSELKLYLKLENKKTINSIDNINLVCNAYEQAMLYIKNKNCNDIFKCIDNAKNIYLIGFGMVQSSIKKELKRIFMAAGKIFYDISGYNEAEMIINLADSDDVFILISVSGENEFILNCAKYLNIRNIQTISITELKDNSLAHISSYNLYISSVSLSSSLNNIVYNSVVSYFILIEILFLKYIEYKNIDKRCDGGYRGVSEQKL
ncbi:MurR/RpiR family transcriptional regulator [[Clostridium] colinum]|uniref:MurR/RpiR family transcriptional regulator n=1 Tax=[Clostridium] colinum TaxID=36835 RepID=UPI0020245439|nr:MurR/RpiR family transcriptional regulator [[Clostridium] colinum]